MIQLTGAYYWLVDLDLENGDIGNGTILIVSKLNPVSNSMRFMATGVFLEAVQSTTMPKLRAWTSKLIPIHLKAAY